MTRIAIRPEILYAWKGAGLLVVDTHGECGSHRLAGYYFREARHIRTLRFEIDGKRPWLCEAAAVAPDELRFTYSYPEVARYGGGGSGQSGDDEPRDDRGLPQRGLIAELVYRVRVASLDVKVALENRSREELQVSLGWILDADFADLLEAQSDERQQDAPIRRDARPHELHFTYDHPDLPYAVAARLSDAPAWHTSSGRADASVRLRPGETIDFGVAIVPSGSNALSAEQVEAREARLDAWRQDLARIAVPGNRLAETVLARNIRDLASFPLLEGREDEWLAPAAGAPLYPAFFGRDAMTAGWQAACLDSGEALDAAMTKLGRMQSTRVDDWRDEEPGRIPYQVRTGPLALLNRNPYSAYYADYASPLMFVISLANLYAWSGSDQLLAKHWDTARRILDWAREFGDADGDGYLEYQTRSSAGTKNQGWKDSGDAIVYDDGSPVPSPTATCELQGYWYAAQQLMGVLGWMRGADDWRAYQAAAADLKARFNRDWWVEEAGCFALAMDPGKQLIPAVTSNVGHCLASGIVDRDHLRPVVGRLFAPDMFSGWGIRTLSSDHQYYNPLSYHRGSVWAVEQATMVFGLRRFGFDARAGELASAMFDLAQLYDDYRIPETIGGYARGARPTPGAYPQANTPQLWNASGFLLVVQTLLGLLPLASHDTLIVDPSLPAWLPDITIRNLRVGSASIALRCWRNPNGTSDFEVLHKQGTIRVVRQPPPESLTATLWDRGAALVDTAAQALPASRKERAS